MPHNSKRRTHEAHRITGVPHLTVGERARKTPLPVIAPGTVDVSVTGRCQLRCEWCWGPEHHVAEMAPLPLWRSLLSRLAEEGTEGIVFTGGEPLISPYLPPLLHHAYSIGLRTTLSTNGILLNKRRSLLRFVDDIGIPIDGHTAKISATMRKGSDRVSGWERAISAIKLAQGEGMSVTVRTVVSARNLESVLKIPNVLEQNGVDIQHVRFKLYQVEPIGPHFGASDWSSWEIDSKSVVRIAQSLAEAHSDCEFALQLYSDTAGRYFQVDPAGEAFGTDIDSSGKPFEVHYGNLFDGFQAVLSRYSNHKLEIAARQHGVQEAQAS